MKKNLPEIARIARNRGAYERLEQVIGCKWSVSVLEAVRVGITRPGALERNIEGISTKVLSERLRRLTDYGLLLKESFPEVPPRTVYSLTRSGEALVEIISKIRELDADLTSESGSREPPEHPHPTEKR